MRLVHFIECPTVDDLREPWKEVDISSFEGDYVKKIAGIFKTGVTAIYKVRYPAFHFNGVSRGVDVYLLMYPENGERALLSEDEDAIWAMYCTMFNAGLHGASDRHPESTDLDLQELRMWEPKPIKPQSGPRIMVNINNEK